MTNFQKFKKVDGELHLASDFAYVPNPEKPSTWKLPIFDMRHIGGAEAAINSDYRGKSVEIPADAVESVRQKIQHRKNILLSGA